MEREQSDMVIAVDYMWKKIRLNHSSQAEVEDKWKMLLTLAFFSFLWILILSFSSHKTSPLQAADNRLNPNMFAESVDYEWRKRMNDVHGGVEEKPRKEFDVGWDLSFM